MGSIKAKDAGVECAGCGKWEWVQTGEVYITPDTFHYLSETLRERGWSNRKRDRRWRCPECSHKRSR